MLHMTKKLIPIHSFDYTNLCSNIPNDLGKQVILFWTKNYHPPKKKKKKKKKKD